MKNSTLVIGAVLIAGVAGISYLVYKTVKSAQLAPPVNTPTVIQQAPPQQATAQKSNKDIILDYLKSQVSDLNSVTLNQVADYLDRMDLTADNITIRNLTPADLNLTGSTWSQSLVSGWNTLANSSTANDTVLAIRGITYNGTVATQVRITKGVSASELWDISSLNLIENHTYVDPTIQVVDDGVTLKIEAYASGTSSETIIFNGYVFEKRGKTLV